MEVVNVFVLYVTASAVALQLVAGGWVKVRDYFKAKAAAKVAVAAAEASNAAIQKQLEIDAAVAAALEAAGVVKAAE